MSTFHIPTNYTDAGKLLGIFEIRNAIESAVLSVPLFFICFSNLPFSIKYNFLVTITLVIPIGGFALIGINDDCLTRFVKTWWQWKRNKGIITFRGMKRLKRKAGKVYES